MPIGDFLYESGREKVLLSQAPGGALFDENCFDILNVWSLSTVHDQHSNKRYEHFRLTTSIFYLELIL